MTQSLLKRGIPALALVAFAAGCNETEVNQRQGVLLMPALTDVGDVPVGSTHEFPISFANGQNGNEFGVESITVNNIDGDFFAYNDGATPFTLERDGNVNVPFEYSPDEEGYHLALVNVLNGGRFSEVQVTVRGHGALAAASVWPLVLDYGPVGAGFSRGLTVTVSNDGDVPFTIFGAAVSDPQFAVTEAFGDGIEVLEGELATFTVEFTPSGNDPQPPVSATLDFDLGDFVTLRTVTLRANDCENGDPAEYDVDGDGFTSCGGDCDDFDEDSYPGAQDVCDGADNDCDNTTDEGSTCWDDDGDGYCEGGDTDGDGAFDCLNSSLTIDHSLSANLDCNDGDPAGLNVNPGETEVLGNGIDDDCDGQVDQGSTDSDSDGYSPGGGDCDDADGTVFPGAPERADSKDNDCDNTVDEGTVRYDDDGDCYCEATSGNCSGSIDNTCTSVGINDCNDTEAATYPTAPEIPDYQNNDCDLEVDEGTIYADDDGDGFNDDPSGGNDCDDNDA
ncbi:MAG: putative metal-binding motif-containing protein, partial [Proteobacteria bacterium]|nr:putative metal-binding motif-containing protein [Pseudomonadota bacterium]